ncbi:hypothetical protein [Roseixanthobacter liquoris]
MWLPILRECRDAAAIAFETALAAALEIIAGRRAPPGGQTGA